MKKCFLHISICFLFSVQAYAQPANDTYAAAIDVTALINTCSADAAYTTVAATADNSKGSLWDSGPNYNVWFKFTASTAYMKVQLKTGGSEGTLQHPYVAMWQTNGTTEITSVNRNGVTTDLEIDYYGLTPGTVYYISVDNLTGTGYRGTFKLCLSDVVDYNFYEGATVLTDLENWCSADQAYTTLDASADKAKGTLWDSGPNYNRWFKFTALFDTLTVQLKTGGAEGTLQHPYVALWASNGTTCLASVNRNGASTDLTMTYNTLVPGTTYYISVDNLTGTGYRGTFKLCVNNVSAVSYYSRANGNWNVAATWSRVAFGGAASASVPGLAHRVHVRDNDVTVTTAQSCAELNVSTSAAGTSLTVDATTLTVAGEFSATNSTNNSEVITVQNGATLAIMDDATFTRGGGNSAFQFTVNNASSVSVGNDLLWTGTAGTVQDNLLTANNTSSITVTRDVTLNYSGGQKIGFIFNNSTVFTIGRDLTFTSTAAASTEVIFNSTAGLFIKRNIVRGATPYGMLTFNGTSSLTLNGSTNSQVIAASAGSGGDGISYRNIIFNNTNGFVPNFTMGGTATVNGTLTLTDGIAQTTAGSLLALAAGTSTSIGSASSFISGPVNYTVAGSGITTINFPVGKSTTWGPSVLAVDHSTATPYTYTAEMYNASAGALGYTLAPTTDQVSGVRYWIITRSSTLDLTSATATLYYDLSCYVTDYTMLTVVKNTSATPTVWTDIGGTATGNGNGSITSGSFTSFSTFTIANELTGTNPLPVELLSLEATSNQNSVEVAWSTSSEKNCDYFFVEKSADGNNFSELEKVKGAGNSSTVNSYKITDTEPYPEISYYRLKQVDFNGSFYYSDVVAVEFHAGKNELSVYPTISSGNFSISFSGTKGKAVLLVIRNVLGQEHYSNGFILDNELYVQSFSLSGKLPAGVYVVTAASDDSFLEKRIVIK